MTTIESARTPAAIAPASVSGEAERAIDAGKWTEHHPGFSWAWNLSIGREQLPETKAVAEAIEAAPGHKLVVGSFVYSMSSDRRFLHRVRKRP